MARQPATTKSPSRTKRAASQPTAGPAPATPKRRARTSTKTDPVPPTGAGPAAAGAERLYRQWLDYDPENAEARTQLAMILFSSKQYEQAVAEFDTILAATPGAPEAATYRAAALYQLKRYADAIAGFEALVGATDQFAVFQLLSKSYQAVGRRQDAISTLETYLARVAPEDPNAGTAKAALEELRGGSQR